MIRILVATKDEQIITLLRFLLKDTNSTISLEYISIPFSDYFEQQKNDLELLFIDVDQINKNNEWIQVLKERRKMKMFVQFNNSSSTTVTDLIDTLEKNDVQNSMEFIILDNYSDDLKLILIRQVLLDFLS